MPRRLLIVAILVLAATAAASEGLRSGPGADRRSRLTADEVLRVVDGDTVVLRASGRSRLIGVDTPEVGGRPRCFGREASAFAKRLLPRGVQVGVQRDVRRRDRYGRTLIYLRLPDRRWFNDLLVARGFAVPLTTAPNVRRAARFRELSRRARERAAGLWSSSSCDGDPDRPAAPRTPRRG